MKSFCLLFYFKTFSIVLRLEIKKNIVDKLIFNKSNLKQIKLCNLLSKKVMLHFFYKYTRKKDESPLKITTELRKMLFGLVLIMIPKKLFLKEYLMNDKGERSSF